MWERWACASGQHTAPNKHFTMLSVMICVHGIGRASHVLQHVSLPVTALKWWPLCEEPVAAVHDGEVVEHLLEQLIVRQLVVHFFRDLRKTSPWRTAR